MHVLNTTWKCFQKYLRPLSTSAVPDDIWGLFTSGLVPLRQDVWQMSGWKQGESLAKWLQGFYPQVQWMIQSPLFHSKHHHIYLGILDSDMLQSAWAPRTLPFFQWCTSVTFKVLWMFSISNICPSKNSGLDSRKSRENKTKKKSRKQKKQSLLLYPLNLYKHLKFYSHQIHLIIHV